MLAGGASETLPASCRLLQLARGVFIVVPDPGPEQFQLARICPSLSNTKVHLLKGCTQFKVPFTTQPVATFQLQYLSLASKLLAS